MIEGQYRDSTKSRGIEAGVGNATNWRTDNLKAPSDQVFCGTRLTGLQARARLARMSIPTEPIGSIPRPPELVEAVRDVQAGRRAAQDLGALYADAVQDTIRRFEETGSPVITDGEQTKPSFATYPVHGLESLAADGIVVPFADGHTRQLPRLTAGPFHYQTHADTFIRAARAYIAELRPAPACEKRPRTQKSGPRAR